MRPEERLWRKMRGNLPEGIHASRVENPCDPGTPDVWFCLDRIEGGMELKYQLRPARSSTIVLGDACGLRPSQKLWIPNRLNAGGLVLIVVGITREIYFVHGQHALIVNNWTIDDFRDHCLSMASHAGETAIALRAALRHYTRT